MKGEKEWELLRTLEAATKWVTNGFILTAHFVENSFDPVPADYLCHWNSIFSQRKASWRKFSLRVRNFRHSKSWLREENTLMMKSYTKYYRWQMILQGRVYTELAELSLLNSVQKLEITIKAFTSTFNRQGNRHAAVLSLGGKETAGKRQLLPMGLDT